MPRRVGAIRDLPFKHNLKPGLAFEIFRLAELFARPVELGTSERPDFTTIYIGLRGSGSIVVDFEKVGVGERTLTIVASGRVQQIERPSSKASVSSRQAAFPACRSTTTSSLCADSTPPGRGRQ